MSGITAQKNDAASLLEVLQNSEMLEKRLGQLRDAEAQAKAVIDLAGPASEIVQMREQIGQEHAALDKLRADTQADCDAENQAASEHAMALIAKAETDAADTRADADQVLATAQSKMSEANAEAQKTGKLNSDLAAAQQACAVREESLNARLLELEEERQLLADERKKLAEVRDSIGSMLG